MKLIVGLSLLGLMASGSAGIAAEVTPTAYSDIDVVAVAPRSSAVKPFVMAVYTKEQLERAAAAGFKRSASNKKPTQDR